MSVIPPRPPLPKHAAPPKGRNPWRVAAAVIVTAPLVFGLGLIVAALLAMMPR